MSLPVILVGGGGHARVLVDLLQLLGRKVIGFTTLSRDSEGEARRLGVPCLGADDAIFEYAVDEVELCNAIGSAPDTRLRKQVYQKFKLKGFRFSTLVHPFAYVSSRASLAEGAQVMAGVVVQPFASIGENAIINTRASIDHDCKVGAHVHVAPGVTLSGTVEVGEATHIGTGASVIQEIKIGSGCIIGAGALIVKDVKSESKVLGVPARPVGSS